MKLYYNGPSPYARKVMVAIHEKGLTDRIEPVLVDPWEDPPVLTDIAPIGKVPALLTDGGAVISESTTIGEYLDRLDSGVPLIGGDWGDVMSRAALGQGIIDAAFTSVIEGRRPADKRWSDWIARQRRAIERALPKARTAGRRFDLGDIALACGLAYMDFRLPEVAWREKHAGLAAWLDVANRRPSMQATKP